MVILGAKGFAKEVLEIFNQRNEIHDLYFYDDISADIPDMAYGQFPILKSLSEIKGAFAKDPRFALGVGTPHLRRVFAEKMSLLGGVLTSVISPHAFIGNFGNTIGAGASIMTGTVITNDVGVGTGTLINLNCTIGHDVVISDFCELSPGVHISGNVRLSLGVVIGTGAVILPGVCVGKNSIIGAGSVVNKDVPANVIAVGIPAKVIKELS